jgi:Fe-S oxidoreductase
LEKGVKLDGVPGVQFMYHEPCHTPMKIHRGIKVVNQLIGRCVDDKEIELSDRCCGESGTLAVSRPDVSTQVRFRKQQEIAAGMEKLGAGGTAQAGSPRNMASGTAKTKILTSCPSCLQGLSRYRDDFGDTPVEADYIVIELARHLLGPRWLDDYVATASAGGIERVLL